MSSIGHTKGVAAKLGISVRTVEHHLESARKKLNCETTIQAIGVLNRLSIASVSVTARSTPHTSRLSLVVALIVIAVGLSTYLGVRLGRGGASQPPVSFSTRAERLSTAIRTMSGAPASEAQERQSKLVVELCTIAWDAMWGPDEDGVLAAMKTVQKEIRQSYEWAKVHAPNSAVAIFGNGHRLLRRMDSDWKLMVGEAPKLEGVTYGADYGRALVGYAIAQWDRDTPGALESASRAASIFTELGPDYRWDLANAWRHMGVPTVLIDRAKGQKLYLDALRVFEELREPRGIAHCWLSMAQSGVGAAEGVKWALLAVKGFRDLRNEFGINDSEDELSKAASALTPDRRQEIVGARDELRHRANERYLASAPADSVRYLKVCILLDLKLGKTGEGDLATDIELILREPSGVAMNERYVKPLLGYYSALCERLGRVEHPDLMRKRADRRITIEDARLITKGQVENAAKNLTDLD